MYDIIWQTKNKVGVYVNREVLEYSKPIAIANHIKKIKQTTTHRSGRVVVVPHK